MILCTQCRQRDDIAERNVPSYWPRLTAINKALLLAASASMMYLLAASHDAATDADSVQVQVRASWIRSLVFTRQLGHRLETRIAPFPNP